MKKIKAYVHRSRVAGLIAALKASTAWSVAASLPYKSVNASQCFS